MSKENNVPKRRTYQDDIWVVFDKELKAHFYKQDPLKGGADDEIDFGETILEINDGIPSDALNPFMLRFMTYRNRRGEHFDVTIPEKIRKKEIIAHLRDLEGNIVEIANTLNKEAEFYLNAMVFNSDGSIIETRKYSPDGLCSDKKESHRLVVMAGVANLQG